jgi:very-short-patch-repair endonuclease
MLPRNKNLKQAARELRKNMTKAERLLWSRLRRKQIKGLQFYRQKVIGNYIVDFYCHRAKLVIAVDGSHHFTKRGKESDHSKDTSLQSLGLCVLRFKNQEVIENIHWVVEEIMKAIPL